MFQSQKKGYDIHTSTLEERWYQYIDKDQVLKSRKFQAAASKEA